MPSITFQWNTNRVHNSSFHFITNDNLETLFCFNETDMPYMPIIYELLKTRLVTNTSINNKPV